MNTRPPFTTLPRDGHEPADGPWPVLARLPDVSARVPVKVHPSDRPATKSIDYRFDPPQTAPSGSNPEGGRRSALHESKSQTAAEGSAFRPPQPHLFQHAGRVDSSTGTRGITSRVLPGSDPFSIPATSLQHALGPIGRFLMLVVLFTIAGTTILMIGKGNKTPETIERSSSAMQPTLQPTTTANTITSSIEDAAAAPTAAGPLGSAALPDLSTRQTWSAAPDLAPSPAPDDANNDTHVTDDTSNTPSDSAAPAADELLLPLTSADGRPLPQVQTSDPPPAIAHLPGHILQVPSRQATHDNNQPSLY